MIKPALTLLLLGALLVAFSSPAYAGTDRLQLSRDGVHWQPALDGPLFYKPIYWAPGDALTTSFWVRNPSDDAALLSITLVSGDTGTLLATGDATVTATANGQSVSLANVGRSRTASVQLLRPNQPTRVDLTVALPATSGNISQDKSASIMLDVELAQSIESAPSVSSDMSANRHNALAYTGISGVRAVLMLSALCIGGGAALARAGKRRRRLSKGPIDG